MKIEYDKEADALYVILRDVPATDSKDLDEGITIDVNDDGQIVGFEILDASEKLGIEALTKNIVSNIPVKNI